MFGCKTAVAYNHDLREETAGPVATRPAFDVYSKDDAYILEGDFPGVKSEDLSVTFEKDILQITAKSRTEVVEGLENKFSEFTDREFSRAFRLADAVDAENIEAALKDGVLRVKVPLKKPTVKKIAVQNN